MEWADQEGIRSQSQRGWTKYTIPDFDRFVKIRYCTYRERTNQISSKPILILSVLGPI